MPSLRHCSGGPLPSAIHGRGQLPRHPCRGAPCTTPAFGLWEKGQADQDQKPKQRQRQDQQLREQAHTVGRGTFGEDPSADRPPSQRCGDPTSQPQKSAPIHSASHHSTGRALARLQLLILMHRRLERPSGGSAQWATRHGCRVSRARPGMADRGGPTEQDRSEGMPSPGEAPNDRGKSALVTFRRAAQAFRK